MLKQYGRLLSVMVAIALMVTSLRVPYVAFAQEQETGSVGDSSGLAGGEAGDSTPGTVIDGEDDALEEGAGITPYGFSLFSLSTPTPIQDIFADPALAYIIANYLGKQVEDDVFQDELETITYLAVDSDYAYDLPRVESLDGMENLTKLESLDLINTDVTDLSPLADLPIQYLQIGNNAKLASLDTLNDSLADLKNVTIRENPKLTSLTGLGGSTKAAYLTVSSNMALEDLDIAGMGSSTEEEYGQVSIDGNPNLKSLTGLGSFAMAADVIIEKNQKLENLNGIQGIGSGSADGVTLNIKNNVGLKDVSALSGVSNAKNLYMANSGALTALGDITGFGAESDELIIAIETCYRLKDVSGLRGVDNLTTLDLTGTAVSSLKGLEGVEWELKGLKLTNNRLTSLDGLERITLVNEGGYGLTLDLTGNQLSSIAALGAIGGGENIATLFVQGNELKSLEGLENLTNLYDLNISDNQITDISSLDGLPIEYLSAEGNTIASLPSLPNIISLRMANNKLTSIAPLQGITTLTEADFTNNSITDLSPIEDSVNLNYISAGGNQIPDISFLSQNTYNNIYTIDLHDNQISTISDLASAKLPNVNELNLSNNKITDISALANLSTLTTINLSYNLIEEFTALTNLPGSYYGGGINLDLSYNNIKPDQLPSYFDSQERNISYLNLEGNALTNDSVDAVNWSFQENKLYYLNLRDTGVTDRNVIDKLRNELPYTEILVGGRSGLSDDLELLIPKGGNLGVLDLTGFKWADILARFEAIDYDVQSIDELILSDTGISDDNLNDLAELLKNINDANGGVYSLGSVDLSHNGIRKFSSLAPLNQFLMDELRREIDLNLSNNQGLVLDELDSLVYTDPDDWGTDGSKIRVDLSSCGIDSVQAFENMDFRRLMSLNLSANHIGDISYLRSLWETEGEDPSGGSEMMEINAQDQTIDEGAFSGTWINQIRNADSDIVPPTAISHSGTYSADNNSITWSDLNDGDEVTYDFDEYQRFIFGVESPAAETRALYSIPGPSGNYTEFHVHFSGTVTLDYRKTATSYTLRYNANGGDQSSMPTEQSYNENTSATVTGGDSARYSGYTFTGWNESRDGTGKSYRDGDSITMTGDVTLYAQWKKEGGGTPNTYTLRYDANGGDQSSMPADKSYNENTSATVTGGDSARHSGYTFTGWNESRDGTGKSYRDGDSITMTGDVTLYAQWKKEGGSTPNTYTLRYDANGGDQSSMPGDKSYNENTAAIVSGGDSARRSGHSFTGWNDKPGGDGRSFGDGSTITMTGDITLYAQWKENIPAPTYRVLYHLNGGSGTAPQDAKAYNAGEEAVVLSSGGFSRSGYTFTGWTKTEAGTGTVYRSGDRITVTEDVHLYAQWRRNGGTNPTSPTEPPTSGGNPDPTNPTNPTNPTIPTTPTIPVRPEPYRPGTSSGGNPNDSEDFTPIGSTPVPLSQLPFANIFDDDIPLASLPKTGGVDVAEWNRSRLTVAALLAALPFLAWLLRRKEHPEN